MKDAPDICGEGGKARAAAQKRSGVRLHGATLCLQQKCGVAAAPTWIA